MTTDAVIGALLTVAAVAYVLTAMLLPERFS